MTAESVATIVSRVCNLEELELASTDLTDETGCAIGCSPALRLLPYCHISALTQTRYIHDAIFNLSCLLFHILVVISRVEPYRHTQEIR